MSYEPANPEVVFYRIEALLERQLELLERIAEALDRPKRPPPAPPPPRPKEPVRR